MGRIPEHEVHVAFARSGGPGGQNVNKVNSKVILHWSVGGSAAFSADEKTRIRRVLKNRINSEDEIVVECGRERSQRQNREIAFDLLESMVVGAARPPKVRTPTKVSRTQKRKRLDDKRRQSEKKRARRVTKGEY